MAGNPASVGGTPSNAGPGGAAASGAGQAGNAPSAGSGGAAGTPPVVAGSGGAGSASAGSANAGSANAGSANAGSGGVPGGDTWASYAQGFMTTYCVSCHNDDNAGSAERDYHMLDIVKGESADIACGLAKSQEVWSARECGGGPAARQFPPGNGPKPEDAERDRVLAWIDAGMP